MIRFLTAGESHGRGILALIEQFPAGYTISVDEINRQLARRQQGYGRGPRMQIERDKVAVLAGMRHGQTIGSPIACLIENREWPRWQNINDPLSPPKTLSPDEKKRAAKLTAPRPGHADLAGAIKYNTHDLRNILERASARETASRVACGSFARQLLAIYDIHFASHVISIGRVRLRKRAVTIRQILDEADASPVRCVDPDVSKKMIAAIDDADRDKDSLGGEFELRITNIPPGLGSCAQWYTKIDSALAAAVMSIPSVKGVEIGDGFASARKRGSQVHDRIIYRTDTSPAISGRFQRRSNRAGGIEGGITNGEEIVIRAACKPISTLRQPLDTVDLISKRKTSAIVERTDICIVPAAAVIAEAMAAMVLAAAFTDKFGHDSKTDIDAAYHAYMNRGF